jgi:hypothetical protein
MGILRPPALPRACSLWVAATFAVVFYAGAASGEDTLRKDRAGDLGEFRLNLEVALVSRPSEPTRDIGEVRTTVGAGPVSRSRERRGDLGEFRTTLEVGPIVRPRDLGEFRAILDVGSTSRAITAPRGVDLSEFRMTLDTPPESVFPLR